MMPVAVPCFQGLVFTIIAVVPVGTVWGLVNHHGVFQVLVDVYKVLEIVILFVFIRVTWRTRQQAEKALGALFVTMCLFGLVELFLTERGGVGLNLMMSLLPMVYTMRFHKRIPYYAPVMLLALAVLLLSKTRTYIFGMLVSLWMASVLGSGAYKKTMLQKNLIYGTLCVGAMFAYGALQRDNAFSEVFRRFQELFRNGILQAGGYRMYEFRMALQKFLESPLIGKGLGYQEYVHIELMGNFLWGDFMHNAYMEILCKVGLYGSGIYAVGVVLYLRKQRGLLRLSMENGWEGLSSILAGGLSATFGWMVVYAAAPLSSYGSVFLPGIVSLTYSALYMRERHTRLSGKLSDKEQNGCV